MKITASVFVTVAVLLLGCSTSEKPWDCVEAAKESSLTDKYVNMLERADQLDPLEKMALQGALETARLDQVCSAAVQSGGDSSSYTRTIAATTNPPTVESPDQEVSSAPADTTSNIMAGGDVHGQPENHGGDPATESSSTGMDDAMAAGILPLGLTAGTLRDNSSIAIIDPDDFDDLVAQLFENSMQVYALYGESRVLISSWIDGIRGVRHPVLVWDENVLCRLENDPSNIAAIAKTNPNNEILVSGNIDYEASVQASPYLLVDCRIHGYYDSKGDGYQHAIVGTPSQ